MMSQNDSAADPLELVRTCPGGTPRARLQCSYGTINNYESCACC